MERGGKKRRRGRAGWREGGRRGVEQSEGTREKQIEEVQDGQAGGRRLRRGGEEERNDDTDNQKLKATEWEDREEKMTGRGGEAAKGEKNNGKRGNEATVVVVSDWHMRQRRRRGSQKMEAQ